MALDSGVDVLLEGISVEEKTRYSCQLRSANAILTTDAQALEWTGLKFGRRLKANLG